ncbi:MAG: hypothetical protein WBD16_02740 [Pyrinomonadaceae bacterium]
MKSIFSAISVGILIFVVMSCNLAQKFVPGGTDMSKTAELWSDVPRMDGLDHSDMEMPLAIKILIRTALNNLWRLDKEGEDKTPATGDWIVFTSDRNPSDVKNFYTNARMTSFGNWEASKESTCLDGKDNGIDGLLCVFEKTADKKQIGLAIVAMPDEKTKKTDIFFLRVEQPFDANAANKTASIPAKPQTKGPITKLNGTAPYGIESRPMPTGTDLDQLLPKQVGSYMRALLERSDQRGTAATSIDIDVNGVYATYRNGDQEVFVEFSIASSSESAQSSWDVVVGDANEGIYPTDPRFGSFGTEPSYLKVINDSGAFFAWTRGGYFFTANAKGSEADFDAFMNAFPY